MRNSLETKRLILRPFELTDAPAIYEYAKNNNATKWVTWNSHQSVSDSEKFVQFVFQMEALGNQNFAICLKERPDFVIGDVGINWISKKDKIIELGTILNESYWGKGFVSEAFQAVIEYAFTNLDVVRVQGRCKLGNLQSRKMMEKAGMNYEGLLRSSLYCKDQHWDMEMFAVIKKGP